MHQMPHRVEVDSRITHNDTRSPIPLLSEQALSETYDWPCFEGNVTNLFIKGLQTNKKMRR